MFNKDFDKAVKKDMINLVGKIEKNKWSDGTKHDSRTHTS
jgi:hypothetical protein